MTANHKPPTTTTARAPEHPNFVWRAVLGCVGVGCNHRKRPQTRPERTAWRSIFLTTPNDRESKITPAPDATHLARQDKDNDAIDHHDHEARAPTQLHRRRRCPPPVAVRGGLFEVEHRQSQVPAAPQGRGDQVFVQQNVQTSITSSSLGRIRGATNIRGPTERRASLHLRDERDIFILKGIRGGGRNGEDE